MNLFYVPDIQDGLAHFSEEEARHCVHVLRHRPGDEVHLVDGRGGLHRAALTEVGKRRCRARLLASTPEFGKPPVELHLAVAPTKNMARFEWVVEKATEIGVRRIVPLVCEHSERRTLRPERLQKILIAAMKQSLRAYLPELAPLQPFEEALQGWNAFEGQKFMATAPEESNGSLFGNYTPGKDVCILIGPEGGFSPTETALARNAGFAGVSLGPSRLRTETAAVYAAAILNAMNS